MSMITLSDWKYKRNTVELVFVVGPFGNSESFCGIVGSAPELGNWDPNHALMMASGM